ncbi:lipase maturation factor 2-like [Sinocyclocheilus anshuiensis]|uniref:Lipase maturation factor n=1 Tax=Sinocyclocheilus anshuiensis TaxID=1608454 RepID=A0A671KDW6_9TELE|nr:PREDICTED: lipase maturation factor 2-like [Sinocyclocheilus anshuiensis]
MGEIRLPRHMFLWCLSAIYMFAFASLYVQIPGLYGNEGVLPARWQLRVSGKSVVEQLKDSPTLLWFGPRLGLDTQQCMELLSLTGALLSLMTLALPVLRDCRVFLVLWILYLSLYQVGQVFVYFQWDNLLLETGFLAILIAPMKMPWSSKVRLHDSVTFWLARWLLFRLMFASGVVKLNSRCPTWWGLTALTYHYETQSIPTPLAWFAHQLPVWFQKLSVVGMFVIEIAVPFMFFSPIRRHRLVAFYMQILLQLFIILSGNYNFFNILTITLCMSLLDDQHVNFWLRRSTPKTESTSLQTLFSWLAVMLEIGTCALLGYWSVRYFDLQVDWENKSVSSKTAFTYFEFNGFLKMVTVPSIWIGVLSLTWEIISAMFKCASVRGVLWRLWNTIQWAVMAAATVSMFAISLVPYTYIEYDAHSNLWPGIRTAFEVTERYQLVNSYGLFRRMTGVGGRPEVVIEGSMDRNTWTEIEFMYKPGNMSAAPPVVTPHQPRLDWQMWFAALGPQAQSPWFSSLLHRLLQGKQDVIRLIQTDESQYPFSKQPPAYLRANRYKYWFSEPKEDGSYPQRWWRRVYVEEFYPMVHLGDSYLEQMLVQHGLKEKAPPRRSSNAWLPQLLHHVGEHAREMPTPLLLWTLFSSAATVCLLNSLRSRACHHQHESLQNKHADKQATGWTHSNVAQEDAKKQEEEKDDAEEDGKEQEEDATSEEEQEGEIEEEVNTEETDVDSLRKRK